MRAGRAAVGLLAIVLGACSTGHPAAGPTAEPVDKTTLSGTGSETGPSVQLGGSYTIDAEVTAEPGCTWTLSIAPGMDDIIAIATDTASSQSRSHPVLLDAGSYRLVVKTAQCGRWTVSLSR